MQLTGLYIILIFVMKSILYRVRDLSLSLTIFCSSIYSYVYYRSKNNKEEYLKSIKAETLRDASRLTNQSFGISWGFQADDTVMNRIDSGDFLFLKYDCSECLSPESMILCYKDTFHLLDEQYHSVGIAFREQSGLYAIYNEFGQSKVKNYCELVSLPYIQQMTLQKAPDYFRNMHTKLKKIVDFDKIIKEDSINFARRILSSVGWPKSVFSINDLILGQQKINIRTQTNRTLRSL